MNVVITGANGQLGHELVRLAKNADVDVHPFDRHQLDITDKNRIKQVLASLSPAVVMNAAAYTNVDLAENESDRAYAVNADGPAHQFAGGIGVETAEGGNLVVHIPACCAEQVRIGWRRLRTGSERGSCGSEVEDVQAGKRLHQRGVGGNVG